MARPAPGADGHPVWRIIAYYAGIAITLPVGSISIMIPSQHYVDARQHFICMANLSTQATLGVIGNDWWIPCSMMHFVAGTRLVPRRADSPAKLVNLRD